MRARRIFRRLSDHSSRGRTGSRYPARLFLEDDVEVGQGDPEADHLTVLLGHGHELGDHHRPELLRQMIDLVVRHGDKAPVSLPCLVVDPLDGLDLLLEAGHVERANGDAETLADEVGAAGEPLGHRIVEFSGSPPW